MAKTFYAGELLFGFSRNAGPYFVECELSHPVIVSLFNAMGMVVYIFLRGLYILLSSYCGYLALIARMAFQTFRTFRQ
ncbi:hypothetical protein BO71DRAFT_56810 [Aspergillus ellipticus CBS 707.79]|uniref:Uncharacterized protein n=1 Tax=Aspergillus ellipticus CBS 707.79 TaxID=1448320 RepID=A0A319D1F1_9EURO|nr:hypothetical protein BO71DRAFT_56810 [Aspergillus ellipticus CBS 707.79]